MSEVDTSNTYVGICFATPRSNARPWLGTGSNLGFAAKRDTAYFHEIFTFDSAYFLTIDPDSIFQNPSYACPINITKRKSIVLSLFYK
jgi:hypothetical protein